MRAPRPVIIVPYEARWAEMFRAEAVRIAEVFEGIEHRIEHVGSTAVEGLSAKPIIDILLGTKSLEEIERKIGALTALGYEYRPETESELPERRYFALDTEGVRTHHLHGVVLESEFWRNHLAFRDYLRSHPAVAAEYAKLKIGLAARFGSDREGYTNAKSPFIRTIIEAAKKELHP